MYSLAPLLDVENSHIGFYFATGVYLFFVGLLVKDALDNFGFEYSAFFVISTVYAAVAFFLLPSMTPRLM